MIVYTERGTSLLYEVQIFDDFILVRPVGSGGTGLEKLDHTTFVARFDESWVDADTLSRPDLSAVLEQ